jgi:hypothetical protein
VEDKLCVIDSMTHSLAEDHQLLRRGASRSSNLPSTANSSLAKNAGLWMTIPPCQSWNSSSKVT